MTHLRRATRVRFLLAACGLLTVFPAIPVAAQEVSTKPLFMTMRMPVAGGPGRLDQIAYDEAEQRAYIASPSTNTVQVISLSISALTPGGRQAAAPITDLPQPQGLLWLPDASRLVVACGGDGSVRIFDCKDGQTTPGPVTQFTGEAEDLAADAAGTRIWVSHARSISWLDPTSGEKGASSIKLNGHAEALAIDSKPFNEGGRLYASIARPAKAEGSDTPPRPHIAVIDRQKAVVAATWPLESAQGNYALALDETLGAGRLFVACRQPAKVLVLDAATGKEVASLACAGDVDGLAWDAITQRLFITGGGEGGRIHIYKRPDPAKDEYTLENTVPTLAGAATCTLVPYKRLLLVAVPQVGADPGALFHYEIRD